MHGYLYIEDGPNRGEVHALPQVAVVGRAEGCAVRLADTCVSRQQLRIEWSDGAYHMVDLRGRNAVSVNGLSVGARTELRHGDRIEVGTTRLRFSLGVPVGAGASDELRTATLQEALAMSPGPAEIVGTSEAMRGALELVQRVGPLDVTVLVTGESGTGKELVARALHRHSPRANGPLVVVNCAAIPRDLVESELFGHEKGAFTGAQAQRVGKFELASGGTLFLDEVDELPPDGQAKLLRVLEDRKVSRVGGSREIDVDVRIVAATNRDLHALTRDGRFRLDLVYRLEVAHIHVPPLRERGTDVRALALHFLSRAARAQGRAPTAFAPDAMARLEAHDWPGNVRELRNVVERAAIFATGSVVRGEDVRFSGPAPPVGPSSGSAEAASPALDSPPPMTAAIGAAEGSAGDPHDLALPKGTAGSQGGPALAMDGVIRRQIERALAATGGNKKRAATLLGISRSSLYIYLDRFNLR